MPALLRRLQLWQKFSAIGVLAATMCAVPLVQVLQQQRSALATAESEDAGLDPLRIANGLLQALHDHRGAQGLLLLGDAGAATERQRQQAEVQARLDRLQQALEARGYAAAQADARQLRADWQQLRQRAGAGQLDLASSAAAHGRLVEQLLRLNEHVADASGLSLDPVAETYYLMTAMVDHLPRLVDATVEMRGRGSAALDPGADAAAARLQLHTALHDTRLLLERAQGQITKAQAISPTVKTALDGALATQRAAADRLLALARDRVLEGRGPALDAPAYHAAASAAVQAQHRLLAATTDTLELLLHQRITEVQRARAAAGAAGRPGRGGAGPGPGDHALGDAAAGPGRGRRRRGGRRRPGPAHRRRRRGRGRPAAAPLRPDAGQPAPAPRRGRAPPGRQRGRAARRAADRRGHRRGGGRRQPR